MNYKKGDSIWSFPGQLLIRIFADRTGSFMESVVNRHPRFLTRPETAKLIRMYRTAVRNPTGEKT